MSIISKPERVTPNRVICLGLSPRIGLADGSITSSFLEMFLL